MKVFAALLFALAGVSAYAQPSGAAPDVLFQGFYWNAHPGDHATNDGGVLWDSLGTLSPRLSAAGVQTIWIPSPAKGGGGRWSMGYDPYDYYDLGSIDQKGSVRTRFGTETQLRDAIAAMKTNGLRVMADAVLNHRDGADAQSDVACVPGGGTPFLKWNVFDTGSGRFPAGPESFHSNSHHCDFDAPYHDSPFGQDMCYFHQLDGTLGAAGAWYNGPHQLGAVGDSLVVWGRWLVDDLGVDEVRLDAIKHIEPGFLAPWIMELASGDQPFALGEFWASTGEIKAYHDEVEAFASGSGATAQMAMFDFGLRYALRDMANGGGGYDMSALNSAGLHFETGLDPFSVVTFVENHDVDRIGWEWADCATDPDAVPSGPTTCVKLGLDVGHDPIIARKNLAYAIMMASEGRPTVFWKDYLWYGLDGEIDWLMALRRLTAQGESAPLASLAPNPEANQADLWALRRDGFGDPRYGSVLAVSDGAEEGAWVDSPHSDYELKDYSDAYAFETTRAFTDGRAYVKARGSDYAWWAPTGLYPRPLDEPASSFALTAEPGGHLHHVVLRVQDAATLMVAGAPIQPGDEVAVLAPEASVSASGGDVAGIGRVGQRLRWDGQHDMVIEVLGNDGGGNEGGRLAPGDALRLVVFDASTGLATEAGSVTWGTGDFTYTPLRPATRGGAFTTTATDASGTWGAGAVSLVTGFAAGTAPLPREVKVEAIPYRPEPPIVLAPGENTMRFRTRSRNTTRDARTETIWTVVRDASGAILSTNFVPTAISFSGRETIKTRFTQKVPASTPAGDYAVDLYIGQYPDTPQDVDTFSFTYGGPPAVAVAVASGDEAWALTVVTEPDEGLEATPEAVRVWPLAPNPFRDRAELRFSLPEAQPIRVELLDARGRRVAVLYEGTPEASDDLRVRIDGRDLPAGIYLVRLSGDGIGATQTVIRAR